jgi:hypothetical protein
MDYKPRTRQKLAVKIFFVASKLTKLSGTINKYKTQIQFCRDTALRYTTFHFVNCYITW